jgi:tetratricopeptide (TPR) repeat protein
MIDNNVFKEIANEIKALHNSALEYIKKYDYDNAIYLYQKSQIISEKMNYFEGVAMSLFNIANVLILANDAFQAIEYAARSKKLFNKSGADTAHCDNLLSSLAGTLKAIGINHEKKGEFKEAIRCYTAALPYADRESKIAMKHEIELLRGYTDA